jgi:predicted transcriptional regulator
MPVEFDTYEEETGQMDLSEGSNAHAILSFLAERPDQGFTPTEIHESVEIPYGSVGPTLARLEERELVRHKAPYWSIGHGDHLATYAGMRSTIEATEERFGPENPDDWLEAAEPVNDG